jgi:hypothetical protein
MSHQHNLSKIKCPAYVHWHVVSCINCPFIRNDQLLACSAWPCRRWLSSRGWWRHRAAWTRKWRGTSLVSGPGRPCNPQNPVVKWRNSQKSALTEQLTSPLISHIFFRTPKRMWEKNSSSGADWGVFIGGKLWIRMRAVYTVYMDKSSVSMD